MHSNVFSRFIYLQPYNSVFPVVKGLNKFDSTLNFDPLNTIRLYINVHSLLHEVKERFSSGMYLVNIR